MLNDLHVHGAQLLMRGVSHLSGLQNPLRGANLSFEANTGEMVHVLHSANHWLTVSTVGVHQEDTIRQPRSTTPIPHQETNCCIDANESITIEYANVQVIISTY